ncbi:DUF2490 domain-containing protein [Ekhidna sp.]|uniref:DUF2490 domain-containing protein n=1 Tax=Ekhidna sp. TaxID=2608089 RepID=UPI003CCC0A86
MRKFILCFILVMIVFTTKSQETSLAWESAIAANYSIDQWDLNTSVGHRTLKLNQPDGSSTEWAFFDLNQFISRRLSPDFSIAIGYKYRRIDPIDHMGIIEQRITQQLAYTHLNDRIRLLSRFRAEQRFFTNVFEHRYRYRFSADMPLSGFEIDVKEFYVLASNEVLLTFSNEDYILDNRINIGIGYVATHFLRLQLDLTQRSENLNQSAIQIPFITSSAVFKL